METICELKLSEGTSNGLEQFHRQSTMLSASNMSMYDSDIYWVILINLAELYFAQTD